MKKCCRKKKLQKSQLKIQHNNSFKALTELYLMDEDIQLCLYKANCDADGVSEGGFYPEKTDDYSQKRYLQAIATIQKHLQFGDWGIHISGIDSLVKSENEALELMRFAEQNIKGAEGIIRLSHCNHGMIVFERKIRFKGIPYWPKTNVKGLVEKFKTSDYQKNHNVSDAMWEFSFKEQSRW